MSEDKQYPAPQQHVVGEVGDLKDQRAWLVAQGVDPNLDHLPSPEVRWIVWLGGDFLPVPPEMRVTVLLRDGTIEGPTVAREFGGDDSLWKHRGAGGDIVAYTSDLLFAAPPHEHLRVKPLEWRSLGDTDREAAVADSILGKWEVWQFPNGSTYIMKPGEHHGTVYEDSYDEAKAYLERVYQRRIAPALTTEGQP